MGKPSILEAVKTRILLGDGAMGTQLQIAGLKPGECGEAWNLDRPDEVEKIQKRYAEAGSDCVITNTFGGCAILLKKRGLQEKVKAVNAAAARIARRALGPDKYVLGDIGPCGEMLEPLGTMTEGEMEKAFREQAEGLLDGGADALIIETMMSLEELLAAIRAIRSLDGAVPVIASMAYNKTPAGYATMMGVQPATQASQSLEAGADVIACNCGESLSVEDHAGIVAAFRAVCDAPLMTQPNAGKPEVRGGRVLYHETPEKMAESIPRLIQAGARIIGGCCGTTPAHIAAFRKRIDSLGTPPV